MIAMVSKDPRITFNFVLETHPFVLQHLVASLIKFYVGMTLP